tara:strand:+ start:53 stop:169 length:117 start_codon:yes stop_codon:yes gene_type:complete
MAGGFESPLTDSEVGTDINTDKNLKHIDMVREKPPSAL